MTFQNANDVVPIERKKPGYENYQHLCSLRLRRRGHALVLGSFDAYLGGVFSVEVIIC